MIGMGIVVEALCSNRLKENIAEIPDDTLVLFTGRLQKGYVSVDFIEKSKETGLLSDIYAPQEWEQGPRWVKSLGLFRV